MLKIAQKHVVSVEPLGRLFINATARGTGLEHRTGGFAAQLGFASAADDLKCLANEFDFSDAAATEFDIGTAVFDGFFTCGFRTDHFVNFRQGTDGAEIYVFPKHKRPHHRIEIADGLRKVLFTSKNATVDNASFEPGKAFPVATLAVEILFKHCRGNHQGTAVTKRTQTHVHAKHKTGAVDFVDGGNDAASQPIKELMICHLATSRRKFTDCLRLTAFVVNKHEIDVGTHVELLSAQFAHSDNQQILGGSGHPHRNTEALRKFSRMHPHGS